MSVLQICGNPFFPLCFCDYRVKLTCDFTCLAMDLMRESFISLNNYSDNWWENV
ncbi:hypothetical protein [Sulfolobus tengchongensis spindle-shaped virus 3]|nr:hypothetical protein [Sulfolobus tengchongensis spindle-shaped virus 3]